jgi:hypothetical protein
LLDPALKRAVMAHAVEAMSVSDDVETVSAILRAICHEAGKSSLSSYIVIALFIAATLKPPHAR